MFGHARKVFLDGFLRNGRDGLRWRCRSFPRGGELRHRLGDLAPDKGVGSSARGGGEAFWRNRCGGLDVRLGWPREKRSRPTSWYSDNSLRTGDFGLLQPRVVPVHRPDVASEQMQASLITGNAYRLTE